MKIHVHVSRCDFQRKLLDSRHKSILVFCAALLTFSIYAFIFIRGPFAGSTPSRNFYGGIISCPGATCGTISGSFAVRESIGGRDHMHAYTDLSDFGPNGQKIITLTVSEWGISRWSNKAFALGKP